MSPIRFEPSGAPRVDLKYLAVVAVLLVVIIVVLAQLWMIERQRRVAAEDRLTELYLKEQLRAAGELEGSQAGPAPLRPVRRGDLPAQAVKWNGQDRVALVLGAATGRAMGFAPGDIIVVAAEVPVSASAPAPAGAP